MDMKPSAMLKALGSLVGRSAEIFSHFHTASDLLGAIRGHEPSKDAPAIVRGFSGVFGKADERALEVLINELEDMWRKKPKRSRGPNPREVLAGFFAWHFRHDTAEDKILTWWYGNELRSFITKMGSSEGRVEATEEKVVTSKDPATGATARTVIKKEHRSSGSNNALRFLETMVDIICSEPERTVEPKRLQGYEKLLGYLEAFHYPHVPQRLRGRAPAIARTTKATASTVYRVATTQLEVAADSIEDAVAEKRRNRSFWAKLGNKL